MISKFLEPPPPGAVGILLGIVETPVLLGTVKQ